MPNYSFRCKDGHITDRVRPFDWKVIVCPECGKEAVRQTVYAPTVRVVGDIMRPVNELPEERNERKKRELKRDKDWDYDRALEHIHNNMREDAQGNKVLDVASANKDV